MNALNFVDILVANFSGFNQAVFGFWAIFGLVLLVLETISNGIKGVSDPSETPVSPSSSSWVLAQLAELEDKEVPTSRLWPTNLQVDDWGFAEAPVVKEREKEEEEEEWETALLWAGA